MVDHETITTTERVHWLAKPQAPQGGKSRKWHRRERANGSCARHKWRGHRRESSNSGARRRMRMRQGQLIDQLGLFVLLRSGVLILRFTVQSDRCSQMDARGRGRSESVGRDLSEHI